MSNRKSNYSPSAVAALTAQYNRDLAKARAAYNVPEMQKALRKLTQLHIQVYGLPAGASAESIA